MTRGKHIRVLMALLTAVRLLTQRILSSNPWLSSQMRLSPAVDFLALGEVKYFHITLQLGGDKKRGNMLDCG